MAIQENAGVVCHNLMLTATVCALDYNRWRSGQIQTTLNFKFQDEIVPRRLTMEPYQPWFLPQTSMIYRMDLKRSALSAVWLFGWNGRCNPACQACLECIPEVLIQDAYINPLWIWDCFYLYNLKRDRAPGISWERQQCTPCRLCAYQKAGHRW